VISNVVAPISTITNSLPSTVSNIATPVSQIITPGADLGSIGDIVKTSPVGALQSITTNAASGLGNLTSGIGNSAQSIISAPVNTIQSLTTDSGLGNLGGSPVGGGSGSFPSIQVNADLGLGNNTTPSAPTNSNGLSINIGGQEPLITTSSSGNGATTGSTAPVQVNISHGWTSPSASTGASSGTTGGTGASPSGSGAGLHQIPLNDSLSVGVTVDPALQQKANQLLQASGHTGGANPTALRQLNQNFQNALYNRVVKSDVPTLKVTTDAQGRTILIDTRHQPSRLHHPTRLQRHPVHHLTRLHRPCPLHPSPRFIPLSTTSKILSTTRNKPLSIKLPLLARATAIRRATP
jgi:hypothetical protein